MLISQIKVKNYRNLINLNLEFNEGLNILLGNNGQGKTNILEAINFISNLRSFRTNNFRSLINYHNDLAKIELISDNTKYSVIINNDGKFLKINNSIIKKTSDFIGKFHSVLFNPNDVYFFDQSAKFRRSFFDLELSKIDNVTKYNIFKYDHYLSERNALLKNKKIDYNLLNVLDEANIESQFFIFQARSKLINKLSQITNDYFLKLTNLNIKTEILYQTHTMINNFDEYKNVVLQKLKDNYQKDSLYQHTTMGIHRDNFNAYFNNDLITLVASQGQKRLYVLAFKLALIDVIHEYLNYYPIALFDDVLSELDIKHQSKFLSLCPKNIQTIITSTHLQSFKNLARRMSVFVVDNGNIKQRRIINE